MRKLFWAAHSRPGRFVFRQVLKGLESSLRYRWNDPRKLVAAAGVQSGQTVLEVGCGSGFFTPALSDNAGERGLVQAIDLHPLAVEATRRKMQALGKQNVLVSKADAHDTGFAEASFDTILLYGVVPAPVICEKRLAHELYRLLKPGGILAVWTIAPFWSPRAFINAAPFQPVGKSQGVHRLQKAPL